MTVTSSAMLSGPYVADGVNASFDFTFKIKDADGLKVITATDIYGLNLVVYEDGYTVADEYLDKDGGGVVVMNAPITDGRLVWVAGNAAYAQEVLFKRQGPYNPLQVMDALDRMSIQVKQLREELNHAMRVPVGEAPLITGLGNEGAFLGVGPDGTIVPVSAPQILTRVPFVNVADYGAAIDGVTDDTAAKNAALTVLRNKGGGIYFVPAPSVPGGSLLIDKFKWDYLAGGYGKLRLMGEGFASVIKKRDNDANPLVQIGRSDTHQTYQGGVTVEEMQMFGTPLCAAVLDLWSLTQLDVRNVRAAFGKDAVRYTNCVTVNATNLTGSDSERGLFTRRVDFPDTSYSDSNLFVFTSCAFKDNSKWAEYLTDGQQIIFEGGHTEHNGTPGDANTGGMYIDVSMGELDGFPRLGVGVTTLGHWFENNSGKAAIVAKGGMNVHINPHIIANAAINIECDVFNDGGVTHVTGGDMVPNKPGGNWVDGPNAIRGSVIDSCQITSLAGINNLKTEVRNVGTGTDAAAYIQNRALGHARMLSPAADVDWVFQAGVNNAASGTRVTYASPYGTGVRPKISLQAASDDANLLLVPTIYNDDNTGFNIRKNYLDAANVKKADLSYTVWWTATEQVKLT